MKICDYCETNPGYGVESTKCGQRCIHNKRSMADRFDHGGDAHKLFMWKALTVRSR